MPEVPHRVVPRSQVEKEVRRLRAAVKDVRRYLQDLKAKAEDRAGVDEARIFDAQILMLEDKEFLSAVANLRSEEHTSELQSLAYLVCRLLLEKKKKTTEAGIMQKSTRT